MSDTQVVPNDTATQRLLDALDGRKEALAWLDAHRRGLALFVRALGNGRKALENLRAMSAPEWDHLFELVCNDGLAALQQTHPDVLELFEAVKGNDEALTRLQRKRPSYAKLAAIVREFHERYLAAAPDEAGGKTIPSSAAADVGCLIGEMHLRKHDYHKAIEAFTRAIENQPTADAYEGRARAYRALAAVDEQKAVELIQK
jgi:tetratricopeptide (TPR) repeat protein